MEAKLDISQVALFECEKVKDGGKEVNTPRLVGDKIFDLSSSKLDNLKSVLELNIKKKLKEKYSHDFSRKDTENCFTEDLFPDEPKKGRKAISLIFNLKGKPEDSLLERLLQADKKDFRKICVEFAFRYMERKREVNGVLGIIQFSIKTKKQVESFLSIITSDFSEGILTDEENAIKLLTKIFDRKFKTIILYPFLVGRRGDLFLVSKREAKTHQKIINSDKDIFIAAELEAPDSPQKMLEEIYNKGYPSLAEINNRLGEDYSDKSSVIIDFGGSRFKVSFSDFVKFIDLVHEEGGQGIFIHGKEVHAYIGDSNLLNDQRIKKLNLDELKKKLRSS